LLYIEDESGCDQSAELLLNSLGIETANTELDRWIVSEAIRALESALATNAKIQLCIPLTASALMDDPFQHWLFDALNYSQLPSSCIVFGINADDAQDYENRAIELIKNLTSSGHATTLLNVTDKHAKLIDSLNPDYAKLSKSLTECLSGEDAEPSKMEDMIKKSNSKNAICIANHVSSAGELAMLWQAGIHYVQGSYLQMPISTMNYDFSDIA
jgi:EAL domain-containing protein (putative c-di-GMP-specific phosphodiesterase class I)